MADTPNLALPYLAADQAQKHVTINESLRLLDALVQLAVLDRDLATPPGAPIEGQRWIVAGAGAGAWAGKGGQIAVREDGAWRFLAPKAGWIVHVTDEAKLLAWDGSAWQVASGGVGDTIQNLALLGIGTTADAADPLAAKLNGTLWTAKTVAEGGTGDLRTKMNKESTAKTLSVLFQTAFSGRAELGLIGDDDFRIKVSPDGTAWTDALVINRTTGAVALPATPASGGGREVLTAARTYFVRTDGSDSNTGLTNTAGGAFLTIQKAIDTVAALDLSTFDVVIQVGAGTYTGANALKSLVGAGLVTIRGDVATPGNVVVSTTASSCFAGTDVIGRWKIEGFRLQAATSGLGIQAAGGTTSILVGAMTFGACASGHVYADRGAYVALLASYTIAGNAPTHLYADFDGRIKFTGLTVTLTGSPVFATAFARAEVGGLIYTFSTTHSGSAGATTPRYAVATNGVIATFGGGASYFPGTAAGSAATGGQYA